MQPSLAIFQLAMRISHKELMPEKNIIKFPASEVETHNRRIIKGLYKALASNQTEIAAKLLVTSSELEWWFHGPPHCNHMMRILTGDRSRQIEFRFKPRSIKCIGDRVIVEGWKGLKVYWVHVWSFEDGIVTQFREYFNTWLTVIHRVSEDGDAIRLWQSEPRQRLNRSLPDLVLAM
ncbi:hypothetical protein MANES_16G094700v8 [Manihot esculenta]|uniref:Uncharacterized protein n=1 Tax=Manihot esculenta TaxID=3983 RepID=A0ACB7G6Y9_MANES|nr:hypothetical protein MANES_16G094700v8 [Manihot esculenta]